MNASFRLWSPAFDSGAILPEIHLRRDANLSPPLRWESPPAGTESFALICFDPEAAYFWYHWLVLNIPPQWRDLPQNFPRLRQMQDLIQGSNSFHALGYDGPEPPAGEEHRYFFRLYALNQRLNLVPGLPGAQVAARLHGKVLGQCELMTRAATPGLSARETLDCPLP